MTEPKPLDMSMALGAWLVRRFGGEISEAAPPVRATEGRDFATYLVQFSGERLPPSWAAPLIARPTGIVGRYPALRREARLQGRCARHVFPAPKVLAVVPPGEVAAGPVEVMERLPGTTAAIAVEEGRGGIAERLGALLAELHDVPTPGWAKAQEPVWSIADRRFDLARFVIDRHVDGGLVSALARVEAILPRLEVSDPAICHGDFHPYNVLVDGDRFGVIDWSTAGVGDRHADLAWTAHLFDVAARSADGAGAPELLRGFARSFIAAYEAQHDIEQERLALWRPVNLLQDLAMIVAERNGLWGTGSSTVGSPRDRHEEIRQEFEAARRVI
jgi:aminoglycoside phosphotransferase (APT) family kinase protein